MSAKISVFGLWLIVFSFLFLVNPVLAANTSSLTFDGSNDYVTADSVSAIVGSTSALSFGAWTRTTTSSSLRFLVGFHTSANGNLNQLWWNVSGGLLKFDYFDGSQNFSNHTFSLNRWYHVFVTISSDNSGVLYVNGESEATLTSSVRPASTGKFTIGQDWDPGDVASDFWQGQIDDVRVYNKALTQDQVKRVMRDDWNDGLVARFKFDENTGCTTFDSVANYQGVLQPTCASSDAPTWNSTVKAPIGVAGPNINDGVESKGSGDFKFIGRTTVENSYIIDSINYSINNSGWRGVGIKDGINDEADEEFEFNFRSDDSNQGYEGYLLDVRVTDSGERESHRIHFEPFNLQSVKKLADGTLQINFNVHQNKNLMKDKLNEYQVLYSNSSSPRKTLISGIPINPKDGCLDPCIHENDNFKASYTTDNSRIVITTKKKFSEPEGKYSFLIIAQSKDNLTQESNTVTLDTTPAVKVSKTTTKTNSVLGTKTQITVTPSASPSPTPTPAPTPYTPPQPKTQSQGGGLDLGQLFVNFHLWLFSLLGLPVPQT